MTATIRLASFEPRGNARVLTLSGASIYQPNDEMRPEAVRPVESVLKMPGSQFEYLFPRASVTRIDFRK